ncbi:Neutral/alkaline nonlysosomal ceramidase [Bisporella sp. PMI_857]|nr:Neutral/alkaline nonlysosomal ceramidase [Bisporella sp. PMI_857]
MYPSQHSEPLLSEDEKFDNEIPDLPRRSKWSKKGMACVASVVLMAALFLVVGTTAWVAKTPDVTPMSDKPAEEWLARTRATGDTYLLGVGKADITGPVVEINFMGYADSSQVGTGLRQRIYSRAFIVGDVNNAANRWVYLVLDTANGDTAVRNGILEGVAALGSAYSVYGQSNIAVTGTHSHSGPGAWLNYLLPQITSMGFDQQSYQAIVDGAVLSIKRAHESLAPGTLAIGETNVTDANINRSLYAYLNNPASERAKYTDNVDKTVTVLRFKRNSDGLNLGILAWHAVHGTSMLQNNTHVSGQVNSTIRSCAELTFLPEITRNPNFVAAFSQANVGDTTPNVGGAYCDDGSGLQCKLSDSTCGETNYTAGTSQACHGRGPVFQALDLGVSSCYEIGRRVFAGTKTLYDNFDARSTPVTDSSVKAYHTFQDMTFFQFPLPNGTQAQSCPAALGFSFAGGTTDGPGFADFTQNTPDTANPNPFWSIVGGLLSTPTPEQKACHSPKPILLNVGQMSTPYAWTPNIIDVQSFRVGQFIIIVSPSEATTMAGRRWRDTIAAAAVSTGITKSTPKVVLGGPANTYAHYVATREEYAIQRYEGASTLYGPSELDAYIHLSLKNLGFLSATNTSTVPTGPLPPDNREASRSISIVNKNGVVWDNPPSGKSFGDVLVQPAATYKIGSVVNTTFVGANPRNNLRLEGTFTAVDQLVSGAWKQIRSDYDWSLVYTWTRTNVITGESQVVVSWETGAIDGVGPGTYRVRYIGDRKVPILGTIVAFTATSSTFTLTN